MAALGAWSDKRWFPAVAMCLVMGVAVLGRVLLQPAAHFLGFEMVDYYGTLWFYWWVDHQLASGESLHHADVFFHPWGKDLFGHTGSNIVDALAAIGPRRLLGPVLGYNVFVIGMMAASAAAFHGFARRFFTDTWALGAATLAFAFMPYALAEMAEGRPTQSILLLPVLFVWMMWRTGESTRLAYPVAAGVLLAATGYQYWYYTFFGVLNCLAYGLYRTARPPKGAGPSWQVLARFALVAAVMMVCTAPFAWALLTADAASVPGLLRTDRWSLAAVNTLTAEDFPVGLYTWQPLRWTAGFLIFRGSMEEYFMPTYPMLPVVALPLVVAGLWQRGKLERGPLLAMLAVCLVLVVGPVLLVGRLQVPNPIYIGLAKSLGFVQRLWWAERLWAFMGIWVALLVGAGVQALRSRGGWWRPLTPAVLMLGWGLDLWGMALLPMGSWDASVPAGYRCLAAGERAPIIEIPYGGSQAHLYYQTVHERPILGGMIEDNPVLAPPEILALQRSNSVMRFIRYGLAVMGRAPFWQNRPPRSTDLERLRELGYRYFVFQHEEYEEKLPGQLAMQLDGLLGDPIWSDARVSIYDPWDFGLPCHFGPPTPDTEVREKGMTIDDAPWNSALVREDERVLRFGQELDQRADDTEVSAP